MNPNPPDSGMTSNLPVLVLLFDALPTVDQDVLRREIGTLQHSPAPESITADMTVNESRGLYGNVQIGTHDIRLIGIAAPYPELHTVLQPAHLRPDQKQSLAGHQTHIICYYQGSSTRGIDQFIALYTLAYGLRKHHLRGVANPLTWMCQSSEMLPDLLTPGFIQSFRQSPASSLLLWLGFVRFHKPDNTIWFATKGSPLFGVPDLAYLGKSADNDSTINMFGDIFTYLYQSGAKLAPGHTMQLGADSYLRFSAVTEYADYLGEKTLVIEKIRASDINRRQ